MAVYLGYMLLTGIQVPLFYRRDRMRRQYFDTSGYLILCCIELMLLAGFIVLYIASGVNASAHASKIFIAVTIFTLLYATAGAICIGIKKLSYKTAPADSKKPKTEKKQTPEYTSRFS